MSSLPRKVLALLSSRFLLLLAASFAAHAIVMLAPGEPSAVDTLDPTIKPEDIERIRAAFHLDDPLHLQYLRWMSDLLSGELASFRDGEPVLEKLWQRLLNSLPLFALSSILIWTLAFPTGVFQALRFGTLADRGMTVLAFALLSVPSFVLAYLGLYMVLETIDLPVMGMHSFAAETDSALDALADRLWHIALPSLVIAASGIALLSRYARAQVLEVVAEDYVRTAVARGAGRELVIYRHVLRNAVLPFITLFGLMLPGIISGSVIVEYIFAWPGIGRLGYEAVLSRDYPVLLALNLFAAALTIAGTTLADLLYLWADPRTRG